MAAPAPGTPASFFELVNAKMATTVARPRSRRLLLDFGIVIALSLLGRGLLCRTLLSIV